MINITKNRNFEYPKKYRIFISKLYNNSFICFLMKYANLKSDSSLAVFWQAVISLFIVNP